MPPQEKSNVRIIACKVFQPILDHLQLENRYPHVRVTYLQSRLHTNPQILQKHLLNKIVQAQKRNEKVILLYGECFPDPDGFCKEMGVIRIPGVHCDEMLLGTAQYQKIIDETAGTYFLEKDLLTNFETYCAEPLELYDEEMRKCYFEHYQRVLYVRQPEDPDLMPKATELANFLNLTLEVADADYSHLENELEKLIESANE